MDCFDEFAIEDGQLQNKSICLQHDLDYVGLPGILELCSKFEGIRAPRLDSDLGSHEEMTIALEITNKRPYPMFHTSSISDKHARKIAKLDFSNDFVGIFVGTDT